MKAGQWQPVENTVHGVTPAGMPYDWCRAVARNTAILFTRSFCDAG